MSIITADNERKAKKKQNVFSELVGSNLSHDTVSGTAQIMCSYRDMSKSRII